MHYLIHASLLLAGCFVYYWLLLRKETHFQLNRWVLLGCLLGALTLPLITVPGAWSLRESLLVTELPAAEEMEAVNEEPFAELQEEGSESMTPESQESSMVTSETGETHIDIFSPTEEEKEGITRTTAVTSSLDWWKVLSWVYLIGVIIFGVNFLIQFGQLVVRLIRNPGHDLGAYRLVEMSEDAAPYSFWNHIFLNPDRYDSETFHQIFQHEQIHVEQKHSIDLILAELLVVFFWFNPFAWWYRKAIEDNLEFLTDAEMLRIGNDPQHYQLSLVKVAVPNFPNGLVASYNQNFLEKRIAMMKTKKSSVRSGWKYLTLLPLLLISMLQFNAVAQVPVPPPPVMSASPVVPASPVTPAPVDVHPAPITVPAPAPAPTPMAIPTPPAPVVTTNIYPDPVSIPIPQAAPVTVHTGQVANDVSGLRQRFDVDPGFNSWTAVIEGNIVCFQFMSRSRANNNRYNWNSSRCFGTSEIGDLPRNQMGEFQMKRTAGTIVFKGVFEGNDGVGNFTFTPAADFVSFLKKEGFGTYEDNELILFFLADMNEGYVRYLKDQGYDPGHQKLIELAIFYDDIKDLKSRIAMLKDMGYDKPGLGKLIELQIHGVDDKYVADLSSAGFDDLSLNDLVKAKIHGLSSRFVTEMNQMGFRDLSFNRLTDLAIHGVSTEYVNELKDLGYTNLNPKEVLDAKIHGVSTDRIAEFQRAGFSNLSLGEAKKMAIHGVNADLVQALADFGFENLTVNEVVGAKIHGVNERNLREFKATGLPMDDLAQLQGAFIHGVNAEQIKGFRSIGYNDLDLKDYTTARIHGITPEFAASFREVGFKDIPFSTLKSLRIHGVSSAFIKDRLKEGRDLKDYIKMKIHGL